MGTTTLLQTVTMTEARCRDLGPLLLSPFAGDLAGRLARLNNGPLLEIAAGDGSLTLAITAAMSAGMTIIATDPDPAMVEAGRRKTGLARVAWQEAEPSRLPFADGRFGIIACQFALATMENRLQAMREARRVMVTGGRFMFNVPGHLRSNPVPECIQETLAELFPADPPVFLPERLHGYADDETIDGDLTEAGFTDAMYTNVDRRAVTTAEAAARGYCLGTALRDEIARRSDRLEDVVDHVAAVLRRRFGDGLVETCIRALVVSASA